MAVLHRHRQMQAFFFVTLLLSAEASRMENPPMDPVASTAEDMRADPTSNVEIATSEKASTQESEPASSALLAINHSAAEGMTDIEMCDDWCISCPAHDGFGSEDEKISWHLKRARGGVTKLAGGVFVAALATLGVVSGVLVVPTVIAGAATLVGISSGAALLGGGLAGAYLVRDFLKEKRLCPEVEFLEIKHSNNRRWFKQEEREETYTLDDVNLLELMSQMEDIQNEPWLQDYERNKNVPEKERLGGLMACNLMRMSDKKWGDMRFQDPNFRKVASIFRDSNGRPSSRYAAVAECAKWLCATKFEDSFFQDMEVKRMGINWHGFSKCGERSSWNVKNWFRR